MIVKEIKEIKKLREFLNEFQLEKFNLWFSNQDLTKSYLFQYLLFNQSHLKIWATIEKDIYVGILIYNYLEWDSNFFKIKCGQINHLLISSKTKKNTRREIIKVLLKQLELYMDEIQLDFCSISVSSWDSDITYQIQEIGFQYVLTWVDCFKNTPIDFSFKDPYEVRLIEEKDYEYIVSLSKNYFKGGRFYLDPNFSNQQADFLYENLIRNSYLDKDSDLQVLYSKDDPIGCCIWKKIEYPFEKIHTVRSLRLLVFDRKKSRPGLATDFLKATTSKLLSSCDMVVSGLEIHNLPSLSVHQKSNFRFNYTHNVFHWRKNKK